MTRGNSTVNNDLVTGNMGYLRVSFLNLSSVDIWGQIIPCCQGLPCALQNV